MAYEISEIKRLPMVRGQERPLCSGSLTLILFAMASSPLNIFGSEIGIGLVGFGLLFLFLGVILFFDRGLLALGNIFFLTGVGLLLGWQSMWQLFTKKANIKGSVPFFLGLFLLFVRWPIAGMIMELYGSFVLFSGYGAPIQAFLYQIPIIGWILQYPFQLLGLRRKRA